MRRIAPLVSALLLLLLSACLKVKQLVVVNPDGSGNIVVSTVIPPETVTMMTSMAGALGEGNADFDPFYDPDQLREAATRFGEDVVLVKSEKVDKDGMRGSIAVYGFKDISKVKLNTQQNMSMNEAMGALQDGKSSGSGDYIRFAFHRGASSRLTVLMPEMKKRPAGETVKPATSLPPELAALGGLGGGGAAALQMFKGMEVNFAVQVKGKVVTSNASHPDAEHPDRFVLLAMDFDKLAGTPGFQSLLKEDADLADPSELMKRFYTLPGAHLETNRETIVEFKP